MRRPAALRLYATFEKLEHQLHKLKTKLQRRPLVAARRDATKGANGSVAVGDDDEEAGEGPRIVKSKRFSIKPMTPQEAALQMDLLGHDFYFFTNSDTARAAAPAMSPVAGPRKSRPSSSIARLVVREF